MRNRTKKEEKTKPYKRQQGSKDYSWKDHTPELTQGIKFTLKQENQTLNTLRLYMTTTN